MANVSKRQQLITKIDDQIASLEENIKNLREMPQNIVPSEKLSIVVPPVSPTKNSLPLPFPMPNLPLMFNKTPVTKNPLVDEKAPLEASGDKVKRRGRKP